MIAQYSLASGPCLIMRLHNVAKGMLWRLGERVKSSAGTGGWDRTDSVGGTFLAPYARRAGSGVHGCDHSRQPAFDSGRRAAATGISGRARAHAHARMRSCMHTFTHTCTHICAHACTHARARAHTHTNTRTHTRRRWGGCVGWRCVNG